MIAEAIERKENKWFVRTKVASDLVIHIGKKSTFHLHILPIVSKSAYLNRIVFERKNAGERASTLEIQLDNLPGGAEAFEQIVKFCYGWKLDLTPSNATPLYCAASFLEMSDDLEAGNLVSRAESFLSFAILSSWRDAFVVLRACEPISSSARDLQVQRRCSEAIAWKVCTGPQGAPHGEIIESCFNFLVENDPELSTARREVSEDWWFEDVSCLRIDHFIEVVASIKRRGIKAEVLGSSIAYWTSKWLSKISFGLRNPKEKSISHQVRRVIVESLIRVLPAEEGSVPLNFLLHLLKLGLMLRIDAGISARLERRIAAGLEQCQPVDLLVKNYGESDALYDVGVVARVVEAYASLSAGKPAAKMFAVGRLVDGYLALVARDASLPAEAFRLLAEALPKDARCSDDNLYRAIDRYLKAHPSLTEEERKEVCRGMEYHKLSQEAREHATKNDRLPLSIAAQFILLEQVSMVKSMVEPPGSMYRRSKSQMVVNLRSESRRECLKVQQEMRMMRQEVEGIKMGLNNVQLCRADIRRMAKRV